MREPQRITGAVFETAVRALDRVGMIRHGLTGAFVDQFDLVAEVHRHRQQTAERCRDEGVADDDCSGTAHNDVAVSARAVDRRCIQTIDENGRADASRDRTATSGFVGHPGGSKPVKVHIGRATGNGIRAMSRKRAASGVREACSRFPLMRSSVSRGQIGQP